MKCVALLRGINVGGNCIIKMADLKDAFIKSGYLHVATYIQSGNVIFETDENDILKTRDVIEKMLSKQFSYNATVVIRTNNELLRIVREVPSLWNTEHDLRRYVAFVREPITPQDLIRDITLKEGVDTVKGGEGVVYMTTKMSEIAKSGFTKLIGKKIYKDITIRNYNTVKKLHALMQEM